MDAMKCLCADFEVAGRCPVHSPSRIDSIDDVRQLLAGPITDGPWEAGELDDPRPTSIFGDCDAWVANCNAEADAALIVAAINALPRLLNELEAARKVCVAANAFMAVQAALDDRGLHTTPQDRVGLAVALAALRYDPSNCTCAYCTSRANVGDS